jgi:hypothetical protein
MGKLTGEYPVILQQLSGDFSVRRLEKVTLSRLHLMTGAAMETGASSRTTTLT